MTNIDYRTIGPYTAGEKPAVLTFDFFASNPPNLTGWNLGLTCERDGTELTSWGSIAWSDATIARAAITMPELALATGKRHQQFVLMAWTGNTVQRLATVYFCFYCHRQVGTTPSV